MYKEDNKIYVFLSHSHHDYEKVRKVRDILENEGFRPLMFFLKCLEKEEYKELTETLIKEEIDSRQRFILCNSENANNSDWVKFEIKHIKEAKRPYEVVDLDWDSAIIEKAISTFKKRSTVFLSYPRNLIELVKAANEELKLKDYRTFFDMEDISLGVSWAEEISNKILQASKEGYVLIFIDENLKRRTFQYKEISIALKASQAASKNRIIPVWASQELDCAQIFKSNPETFQLLGNIQGIDVCKMPIEDAAKEISKQLISIDIKENQHQL